MQISILPLTVHFPHASYSDGVDISNEQFYDYLDESKELPTTAQIPPQTFVDAFQEYLDAGDVIVGIFISGAISGTYQSACIAKEILASEDIYIVDSRSATMSLALLLSEAAKYRDAGYTAPEIAEHVTMLAQKVRFLAAVNTLKYLRKGGRISTATMVIGELLGIKPIVSMIDGAVHSVDKARGLPAAMKLMLQKVLDDLPDLRYGVAFGHSAAPALAEKAIAFMKEPLGLTEWLTCSVGSTIGTYAGRGAVGIAYIAK